MIFRTSIKTQLKKIYYFAARLLERSASFPYFMHQSILALFNDLLHLNS